MGQINLKPIQLSEKLMSFKTYSPCLPKELAYSHLSKTEGLHMRICLPDSVAANNAHLVVIGVVHERRQLQHMIYIKTVQNRSSDFMKSDCLHLQIPV